MSREHRLTCRLLWIHGSLTEVTPVLRIASLRLFCVVWSDGPWRVHPHLRLLSLAMAMFSRAAAESWIAMKCRSEVSPLHITACAQVDCSYRSSLRLADAISCSRVLSTAPSWSGMELPRRVCSAAGLATRCRDISSVGTEHRPNMLTFYMMLTYCSVFSY
jgi:hypothetical protein